MRSIIFCKAAFKICGMYDKNFNERSNIKWGIAFEDRQTWQDNNEESGIYYFCFWDGTWVWSKLLTMKCNFIDTWSYSILGYMRNKWKRNITQLLALWHSTKRAKKKIEAMKWRTRLQVTGLMRMKWKLIHVDPVVLL